MKRLLILCSCICIVLSGCSSTDTITSALVTETVLIDPGHGGFDGGAVAADGTYEKHLNLAVSLILRDILSICGISTSMTRTTDQALAANKSGDMQARLTLYQQAKLVISIHQNQFNIPKYAGTQVFYSGNHAASKALATAIQYAVQSGLQPDNHREIKQATSGIYLLHHTKNPCVLVECGFLSNPAEREQLKSPAYQQKIAFAIAAGYWQYQTTK